MTDSIVHPSAGPASEPLRESDPAAVGLYRLHGRLGLGGMGVAYLASAPDGAWVVVKVIRDDLLDSPGLRGRFAREVDAMRRCSGPGTVSLLADDLEGKPPYLVLAFVPGRTLGRQVEEHGALAPIDVHRLALDVARTLVRIHDVGVVHRDLKPSNIMLSPGGAEIIDFGVADIVESTSLTSTGLIVGSAGWLAPEQLAGDSCGPPTDVHAWACVVTFAATAVPPFEAERTATTMYRVMHETPVVPATMEQPLRGLLVAALDKDPALRPTAAAIVDALEGRQDFVPAVTPPTRRHDSAQGRDSSRRRRTALLAGATVGVLLVGGSLAARAMSAEIAQTGTASSPASIALPSESVAPAVTAASATPVASAVSTSPAAGLDASAPSAATFAATSPEPPSSTSPTQAPPVAPAAPTPAPPSELAPPAVIPELTPSASAAPIAAPRTYQGSGTRIIKIRRPTPDGGALLLFNVQMSAYDSFSMSTTAKSAGYDSPFFTYMGLTMSPGSARGTVMLPPPSDYSSTETKGDQYLKVETDGAWAITVADPRTAPKAKASMSGTGYAVFRYSGGHDVASMSSSSRDLFSLYLDEESVLSGYDSSEEGMLPAGKGYLRVECAGQWRLDLR